ncbi:hypothetical protein QYF61_019820 [Mycteria americana]|uniref:Uncharacterized protein n=1 Tax=Mycteria americana TaxID=33587 RepID=A0AAN7RL49_MYCAM|nr:hypothetical protein QYF61_019820 [Mycteria americana]
MVRQAVLLQPMEVTGGADIHLQPVEDPKLEQVDVPEGGCDPVESPRWSRLLAGPVNPWRKEPTLEQIRLLKAPSNLALNTSNDGASTASLGNLFQFLTTLIINNFFLMSNLNLPSFSLKPLPLVLSLQALDACPSFYFLCISFLHFSLTRRSLLSHAGLLPSLPDFLHMGIESSCALRKMSLSCQLCSSSLSLRAISQGGLEYTFRLAHIPQDCEFHQGMITAAQAAINLDLSNKFLCVGAVMEVEAAATLLTGILSKRGIEAPVKQLIRLIKLGQCWGHFSDTCMLFSVSEWRDFGGTMWQKTIEGDEKDEKEIKAVRGLWNIVLETLKAMKAEREVACAAAQMLGLGVSNDKPKNKPGPIARFFGLPAVKGMSGTVCKNISELREKEGLSSLNEMNNATSESMQAPEKTEVPVSRVNANCEVNAEVAPPKAPRGAGVAKLNDLGGAACRLPPTAPPSGPPSAPPLPPSTSFYPPLPPSTESSETTTPPSGEELPQSSDATAKMLQAVLKRLDALELQTKRKGGAVPPCLMNPPALPRTTRWSGVIKDAILEGQWKPGGGAEGPTTLAFPVVQENGQGKWEPHFQRSLRGEQL